MFRLRPHPRGHLWIGLATATVLILAAPGVARAAFPGSNGKIAFSGTAPGGFHGIVVMRTDGSGLTGLTDHQDQNGNLDTHPAWSPDGTKIAFTRASGNGSTNIYVMNADGTGVTQLTNTGGDILPAWSPDGSRIAFASRRDDSQFDIHIMNANGTGVTNLTNSPGFDWDPAWSPNGRIAYGRTPWDIYSIKADGTDRQQLTTNSANDAYPDWSPAGTQITFASDRSGQWQVYKMDANGANQTMLTSNPEGNSHPIWSPDGTRILVTGYPFFTMNVDGTARSSLGVTGDYPDWQPLVAGHHPPIASFTFTPSSPLTNQPVTFTSNSTGGDGSITGQAWDLDNDGAFDDATGASATHSFTTPGSHIVRLSVVNSQGARDAIARVVVVPPDINSGPQGPTNDPTPTFTFSSEPGASFQCKIDASAYSACTSPKTLAHLPDGSHTFYVRASGPDGYTSAPATRTFTVRTASVSVSNSTISVTAATAAKDNLNVTRPSASVVRVTDFPSGSYTGSGVHVGAGCTRSGDYTANCTSASGFTLVQVSSGDRIDKVVNSTTIQSSLTGGAGDDVLTGGSYKDTLTGGAGIDSMKGMNGNDQLLGRDLTADYILNCDGGSSPGGADKADLDTLPKDSPVNGCETVTRH